jgi:hypothetical protein
VCAPPSGPRLLHRPWDALALGDALAQAVAVH